ncbi:MAG: 2'-5' RNA ligase family protein [Nitrospirota bacterium]
MEAPGMLHQSAETVPVIVRDYFDWHRGRNDFGVWLIESDNEEISRHVEAAREHLSDYLLKPYKRQPHITMFVCGFLVDNPSYDDDYGSGQFRIHARALKDANVGPFFIETEALNSFSSAPFLEVRDLEGGIAKVRTILSTMAKEVWTSHFTPHITVGLYSGTFSSSIVVRKISSFPVKPIRVKVERLKFATYDAHEIAGELTYRHEVALLTR